MQTLINQLEMHCQDGMQKRFFEKLKKIQKFKIGRDGMYLRGLLECFFTEEKYDLVQFFFDKLIAVPFRENFPEWQDTEMMLCLCYELPDAGSEQKQAIENRFLEIANLKTQFNESQILYDNYLPKILSLKFIKGLQREIPNYHGDYKKSMQMALVTEAIRVKIANAITERNPNIDNKMNTIITNELRVLRS
ncbi:hypothetical protein CGC48_07065 [Capnocytophaga cynodegmi]|uniref:Uncharacterized protein n=1 Tax=Capnocytophaga cynodegmi TaxID=28189 RepID=A0A250E608_9FLAO|nr:hypothetical protein [Capnocytophaga cynodegmi]ATA68409.1 hypothetical protein CGC48_07065 [Capnocytophaga cynodegmi]